MADVEGGRLGHVLGGYGDRLVAWKERGGEYLDAVWREYDLSRRALFLFVVTAPDRATTRVL